MKNNATKPTSFNASFWLHLLLVILSWTGPFLFWWPLLLVAYTLVQLQYSVFNRCLMNKSHGLEEEDNYTFYAYLFEELGFQFNRRRLKLVIRRGFNFIQMSMAILWQVVLGIEPLLF